MAELSLDQLERNYQLASSQGAFTAKPTAPQPKKRGGWRGSAPTSWISEILGTVGGVGGFILSGANPLGAAAGAAALGGAGSALEQKIRDDKVSISKTLGEGALEGAFAGIPIGKVAKGVTTPLKGAIKLGTKEVGGEVIERAGKEIVQEGAEKTAKRSLLDKFRFSSKAADMEKMGLKVGTPIRGGGVLEPSRADELYDFARKGSKQYVQGGVKAGAPRSQAYDADNIFNGVKTKLQSQLKLINRSVLPEERLSISGKVRQNVTNDARITGKKEVTENFSNKIVKAGDDVDKLEKIRMEADDLVYKESGGKGSTAKAMEAEHVRDAIDEFVTGLKGKGVNEYKAIKGDYGRAKDLVTMTAKGSKASKGIRIPLTGIEVGEQTIPGLISRVANKGANLGIKEGAEQAGEQVVRKGVSPLGMLARVGAGSKVASMMRGTPEEELPLDELGAEGDLGETDLTGGIDTSGDYMAQLQQAAINAMNAGDMEAMKEIAAVAKTFESLGLGTAEKKPVKKSIGQMARDEAAQLTDDALGLLEQGSIDTGYFGAKAQGVKEFFGKGDSETLDFNTTVSALKASIAKARAGTSFTPNEEKLLNRYSPSPGDTGQQLRSKLNALKQVFSQGQAREYGTEYEPDLSALGV